MSKYILEIRNDRGNEESSEWFEGSEQEAVKEGFEWLREALSIDEYQKEVVVTEVDSFTAPEKFFTPYQGTFGMTPGANDYSYADYLEAPRFYEDGE